ncbi:MAG: hypothetical protein NTZ23_08505 [Cyanobium sp. LacPavin_0920_WC12_MAG_63_22]|nr:hypothetical protein [Cyanobium sp. LacPavin_0920_WC12_MAG_63_22]
MKSRGLALPPVARVQVAAYVDTCPNGFRPADMWQDRWSGKDRAVRTYGIDLLGVRLRFVVERLAPTRPLNGAALMRRRSSSNLNCRAPIERSTAAVKRQS